MCGIFGLVSKEHNHITGSFARNLSENLFILSESRGKESSGMAVKNLASGKILVTKDDIPASNLIKSKEFNTFFEKAFSGVFSENNNNVPVGFIAHSRLVTNGTQENNNNNQPVIKDHVAMIHNGIITNVDALWKKYEKVLERKYEVDTELLASLFHYKLQQNKDIAQTLREIFAEIEGAASVAIMHAGCNQMVFATNTGSFYYMWNDDQSAMIFASEEYILRKLRDEYLKESRFAGSEIHWLHPSTGFAIDLEQFGIKLFDLKSNNAQVPLKPAKTEEILNLSAGHGTSASSFTVQSSDLLQLEKMLEYRLDAIDQLKRCTKCILPETFPYIEFDEKGVCNYCKNYKVKGQSSNRRDKLEEIIAKYRRNDGKPDCLVAFSGGRDSSYGLHVLKQEFGLTPITYTYDWGMVTDLARRNIARITGKLGIENILVSADISKKRNNVHKNVSAWLKRPKLGMIPLFMAGDKQFIKYVNIIKQQTGIELDVWMDNMLENTDFKTGFAGIKPNFNKEKVDKQSTLAKLRMPAYYGINFLLNPRYLNSSIPDTLSAFKSYYIENRGIHLGIFDYIPWDEETINRTLINEYNWETSPDSVSTWRIGDGTAAFYNYIYCNVAGFTEFDTFRSNQIREGMITREFALSKVREENRPRTESLLWYLHTIRIDYKYAIERINKIKKLY